jgi:hypothetical protein
MGYGRQTIDEGLDISKLGWGNSKAKSEENTSASWVTSYEVE